MKFSAHMLAGLGVIAAAGLITPVSAATTGMSNAAETARQSTAPAGSSHASSAMPADNAQSGAMSQNGSMNLSQKTVMQLQQALNSQGEKVNSDGVWGPGTESALKHFQQKNGLPVTGQLDDATKSKLNVNG